MATMLDMEQLVMELWSSDASPPYPAQKNQYILLKQLSHGPTTIVYKALCVPLQTIVAIKIINLGNVEKGFELLDGVRHYDVLPDHPNILKPHLVYIVEDRFYVVMPYMRAGSLQSLISYKFTAGLRPKPLATFMLSILTALVEIHGAGLAHLGVKPGNILLNEFGTAVLSDFGVSSWNYDNEFWSDESHGSLSWWSSPPYWVPPEAFSSATTISQRSDVWSFGITALELLYGHPPISKFPNSANALLKISRRFQYANHLSKCRPVEKQCPPEFKNLLGACLQGPFRRPSAAQLLDYEFIARAAGIGYFARKLQEGLRHVDERFNVRIRKTLTVDEPVIEYIPRRLTSAWTFNSTALELDPYYCMNIPANDNTVPADDAAITSDKKLEEDEIEELRSHLVPFVLDKMLEDVMEEYRLYLESFV